jgi:hypothetical protein
MRLCIAFIFLFLFGGLLAVSQQSSRPVNVWITKSDQTFVHGTKDCSELQDCRIEIGEDITAYIRSDEKRKYLSIFGDNPLTLMSNCCFFENGQKFIEILNESKFEKLTIYFTNADDLVYRNRKAYGILYIKFD